MSSGSCRCLSGVPIFRAGKPVVVSSSQLLCALSHARLPHRDFAFGGKHYSSVFLLDEHDNLTELVPE